MRHYRPMTSAQRDAAAERRADALTAAGVPMRLMLRQRDPLDLSLSVDGQVFVVHGEPARRCNQWRLTLNGEAIGTGGAERAWREIQRRRVPLLGERNLL